MGKFVKLEDWQLDNCNTLGMKGKGSSAKDKFDGGSQDFSARINLQTNRSKVIRKKYGAKKVHPPTVFQYLKKEGYNKTYVAYRTERIPGESILGKSMVIVTNKFLFDNQIKRMGGAIMEWYYENTRDGSFSLVFS